MLKHILLLLLLSTSSFADKLDSSNFSGVSRFGLAIGGETLLIRNDGQELTTAGFIYLSGGTSYRIPETGFQLQASLGYNFDSMESSSGTHRFNELSAEFMTFYKLTDKVNIGLGIFQALSAKLSGSILPAEFGSSTGTVVEIHWKIGNKSAFGLRHVKLDLPFETVNGIDVSASNVVIDGSYTAIISSHYF